MEKRRSLLVAGSTILIAAVVGHLMQNADRYFSASEPATPVTTAGQRAEAPIFRSLGVGAITPLLASTAPRTSAGSVTGDVALPYLADELTIPQTLTDQRGALAARVSGLDRGHETIQPGGHAYNQFGQPCETTMVARAKPAGMMAVQVTASCKPHARLTISHDALRFSAQTDANGMLRVDVPAFSATASLSAAFRDGTILSAIVRVPDATEYERVALQWHDQGVMQLHAHEFGAPNGARGHVWAKAPGDVAVAINAKGGFLTLLGDAALPAASMAEVYSFPQFVARDSGVVRVSVEAPVTPANCGRNVQAETLQPGVGGGMQSAALSLDMPGCDMVGETLVLKNVLRDMKIARN